MENSGMTINGEPVMVPPPAPTPYITIGLLVFLAVVIVYAVQIMPRMGGGEFQ